LIRFRYNGNRKLAILAVIKCKLGSLEFIKRLKICLNVYVSRLLSNQMNVLGSKGSNKCIGFIMMFFFVVIKHFEDLKL